MTQKGHCRFCDATLEQTFVNLGVSPLANSYVKPERAFQPEPFFPLHAFVCSKCLLVQLEEMESPENIFTDYAYFSSFSESWLKHCEQYTGHVIEKLKLKSNAQIVEIASNDGYLLQYFKKRGFAVLGIEPAVNIAKVAEANGIPTITRFFGSEAAADLVRSGKRADLIAANNVLAHVPNINDFVRGMKILLSDSGTITVEFPHLMRMMEHNQFDTIYHEHFSYLSLGVVEKIFAKQGLKIYDVEELSTHGGSTRIYGAHKENAAAAESTNLINLRRAEEKFGLNRLETYSGFAERALRIKVELVQFLYEQRKNGKKIVCYGAPAKGNTLLNYAGVRTDLIPFTVDRSTYKQGLLLPGTRLPIDAPERIREIKPDLVFILPWNLKNEIIDQLSYIREWGGKFVVSIPKIEIL